MPLPPYIKREDQVFDKTGIKLSTLKSRLSCRANCRFAFDEKLISDLKDKGVAIAKVTLHVGAGTFSPVRTDDITS